MVVMGMVVMLTMIVMVVMMRVMMVMILMMAVAAMMMMAWRRTAQQVPRGVAAPGAKFPQVPHGPAKLSPYSALWITATTTIATVMPFGNF